MPCGKYSDKGFICTLLSGHKGDHAAELSSGHIIHMWPQAEHPIDIMRESNKRDHLRPQLSKNRCPIDGAHWDTKHNRCTVSGCELGGKSYE